MILIAWILGLISGGIEAFATAVGVTFGTALAGNVANGAWDSITAAWTSIWTSLGFGGP